MKPLNERAGYREVAEPDALQRDLGELARKHGLTGCVLIEFAKGRVGARAWATTDLFCDAMGWLGTRILTDIADGKHNPTAFLRAANAKGKTT